MTRLPELPVSHYGWMKLHSLNKGAEVWESPIGWPCHVPPGCTLTIYEGNLLCRRVVPKFGTERLMFVIKLEDAK